ncbi:carboxypeptidase regulatory-like domain-containing protein [Pedobacter sp. NJ-S-72]
MKYLTGKYITITTLIFVNLLLLSFCPCFAQNTIKGRIVDANKIPVPFATVSLKIKAADTLSKKNVISTNTGEFLIQNILNGVVEITVSSVGFISYTQTINFDQSHLANLAEIVLHDDSKTLSGVTISAKKKKPLIQQKTDRIIMNVQGSVLASGNNAYDILAMAPSVQLMNGKLTMDGKSNVLILLNGKRLPGATLESILGSLSGEQIERIEFISNPSSKYDASASGGVIEIYTKRSSQMGWAASAGGNFARGYRSGGGAGDADFRLNTEKWDFGVSASYAQKGHVERGYSNRELYQGKTRIGDFSQQMDLSTGSMIDKSLNGSISYQLNKNNTFGADVNLIKARLNGSGDLDVIINENQNRLTTKTFNDVLLQVGFSNYNLFYKTVLDSLGSNFMATTNYARYTSGQQQEFKQRTIDEGTGNITDSHFKNNAPAKNTISIPEQLIIQRILRILPNWRPGLNTL